ncbi:BRCT domain-containing protein/NIF domain-containing protein [Cephalotus follicularis]|uniref:RNA polymerase II C-terminal domain phosphatase-like n=1 Tax=Cephalotus follicularis TaxID=3775 RepID=A0A1Q3B6M1_CEPFO|nr:BRCT domain-containing protein/NIF domain-containing protein [Cephalotus follicularis]
MTVATCNSKSRASSSLLHTPSADGDSCTHPRVIGEECDNCGEYVGPDYGFYFGYMLEGLRLSPGEAARLSEMETRRLFKQKKLVLVLDIDHTRVHSVADKDLNTEEKSFLLENGGSLNDCLFTLESIGLLVKLRPFARTFLKQVSTMFEMYLYTRGERRYALDVTELLDPEATYFGDRIISREDVPAGFKTLDMVLGHKNSVLIVDDTESVWPKDKENLILIERYDYFAKKSTTTSHRYCENGTDESEFAGSLAKVLKVVKAVHEMYFESITVRRRNVRFILRLLRSSILEGCTLYYDNADHEANRVCLMAKEMGAKCSMERNSRTVTHLVSFEDDTEDISWAVQEKKFLVNPWWIAAAYYSWERQQEEEFPVADVMLDSS